MCLSAAAAPARITAIRFWTQPDSTRVAIEVSAEFRYKSVRLTEPDRLFFDIQGARPGLEAKGMRSMAVNDSLLKQIRIAETVPGVTRIVLDLQQDTEFTASQLTQPDRLMVELRAKNRPPAERPAPEPSVTTTPKPVFDPEILASAPLPSLVTPAEPKKPEPRKFEPPPSYLAGRPEPKQELLAQPAFSLNAKPPRLPSTVIAAPLIKRDLPPFVVPVALAKAKPDPVVVLPKPTKTTIDAGPTQGEPQPAKHNTSGDRSLTRVLGLKLGRVVLDPGHGAYDVGTHGPSGLTEKEVVLDVAKRLGALLEERMGTEVIYTRADDTFIPLEERTKIANDHKADLFLSIHANSSPLRYAAGVETYVLNFTTQKNALDLATRENASSERSVYDLKDLLQKIALRDKIDESREFASRLQTALYTVSSKGNTAAKNRGVKKAPFVVLIGAQMPSVLAEIGFLTNNADEALLRRPDHRQKIAEALYKGIANYAETLSHFQVAKRQ